MAEQRSSVQGGGESDNRTVVAEPVMAPALGMRLATAVPEWLMNHPDRRFRSPAIQSRLCRTKFAGAVSRSLTSSLGMRRVPYGLSAAVPASALLAGDYGGGQQAFRRNRSLDDCYTILSRRCCSHPG